jgi:hypothetical protein
MLLSLASRTSASPRRCFSRCVPEAGQRMTLEQVVAVALEKHPRIRSGEAEERVTDARFVKHRADFDVTVDVGVWVEAG